MKNYLLLLILFLSVTVNAQTILGLTTDRKVCAGKTMTYAIQPGAPESFYVVEVTNGTLNRTNPCVGSESFSITWDYPLDNGGQIRLYKTCSTNPKGDLAKTENVTKVNLSAPFNDSPNVSISCGVQQVDLFFAIPVEHADYEAGYFLTANSSHISVPVGWSIISANFAYGEDGLLGIWHYYKIRVQTDATGTGEVKVRFRTSCNNPASYGQWSAPSIITRTPQPISRVGYGDPNAPLKFCSINGSSTAAVSSPSATSFTWTTTNGYTINGLPSPVITTSGSATISNLNAGDGTLSVVANSSCGSSNPLIWNLKYREGPPEIVPDYYEYYDGQQNQTIYNVLPYYSVANNQVFLDPYNYGTNLQARFSIYGATNAIDQITGYNYYEGQTGSSGTGPDLSHIYSTLYEPDEWVSWRITAMNACGTTEYNVAFYASPSSTEMFAVYPNPTSDELIVSYQQKGFKSYDISKSLKKDFSAKLLDSKGKILRSSTVSNNKIIFNTVDIPAGTYFLHIVDGKKVIKKQIVVNH